MDIVLRECWRRTGFGRKDDEFCLDVLRLKPLRETQQISEGGNWLCRSGVQITVSDMLLRWSEHSCYKDKYGPIKWESHVSESLTPSSLDSDIHREEHIMWVFCSVSMMSNHCIKQRLFYQHDDFRFEGRTDWFAQQLYIFTFSRVSSLFVQVGLRDEICGWALLVSYAARSKWHTCQSAHT